jgi:N-acetylneuraminate synthase
LTETNVKVLRPGEREPGLHPKFYDEILGAEAARDIQMNEGIEWDLIER